jgi:hypothetical protein
MTRSLAVYYVHCKLEASFRWVSWAKTPVAGIDRTHSGWMSVSGHIIPPFGGVGSFADEFRSYLTSIKPDMAALPCTSQKYGKSPVDAKVCSNLSPSLSKPLRNVV